MLCDRLNCIDLEGVSNVPEVMRPPPSAKPQMMTKLNEPSEEIRLTLAEFISLVVEITPPEHFIQHIDALVNILRSLCMDPHGAVQREACTCVSSLCRHAPNVVHHFTQFLARSLLTPLCHKHSKVRIQAVEALSQVV